MKLYEVRAKNKRYAQLGEIANIMCTTIRMAKEIANDWAQRYSCVWIIPFEVRDEVVCQTTGQIITIKDEFGD